MLGLILMLGMMHTTSPLVQGQPVVVTITDDAGRPLAGKTIRVFYREGLATQAEKAVGVSDHEGNVTWTPDRGGIARLVAGEQQQTLRVQAQATNLNVLAILGLLLVSVIGLLIYGLVRPSRTS